MSEKTPYADPKLAAYRRGETAVPAKHWVWPLYGQGFENLGVKDRPIQVDVPICGPDQLLVRHDAVGLCFSDTKIIKAGEEHPRLSGRDMKRDPVIMGHEVALTVIQVGENLRERFQPGERYIVQADIYYKGVGMAYGYALQGGLSQYNVVGHEVLDGDEGCYLLPVKPETGYAQAALTEPWACVVRSYDVVYRVGWTPQGVVLIAAGPGATEDYDLGEPYAGGQPPARVVTVGIGGALLDKLRARADADGFTLIEIERNSESGASALAEVASASGQEGFDDIVLLGADPAMYEAAERIAHKGCAINLVGDGAWSGTAQVDVGRLHYDGLALMGTTETSLDAAYQPIRTNLKAGGAAAFLGAAGPMGQMHVQRALQAKAGPGLIVATDLAEERLAVLETKYARLIEEKRDTVRFACRVPGNQSFSAFNEGLVALTRGAGFDDIVVLAPSAGVVAGAVSMLADGAVLNVFAGLPRGTRAPIDLGAVISRGIRFTGTSGSAIRDLRVMLDAAESGSLDPNLSVAAVSGLNDAKTGIDGVAHQRYPGKVVIYAQVLDFPLTSLADLESVLPSVYAKLGPNHSWTNDAEAEFLKELLP